MRAARGVRKRVAHFLEVQLIEHRPTTTEVLLCSSYSLSAVLAAVLPSSEQACRQLLSRAGLLLEMQAGHAYGRMSMHLASDAIAGVQNIFGYVQAEVSVVLAHQNFCLSTFYRQGAHLRAGTNSHTCVECKCAG